MNVFILFLFISTTQCFIYPPKIFCSRTHTHIKLYDTNNNNNDELINLLNKNTNFTNMIYKHNFISSLNENIKKIMVHTKPLRSWNDFLNKKIKEVVKSNNNNNNFINLHYMLFKNQIFESLTPTTKGSGESHCENCHCYECHIKGCYENDLHTKECEDCHKKGCSGCCNCEECLVENEEECSCNCEECLIEKGHTLNDITNNNFIDTVGLVPVGILPNFIIRFLLKKLLMPF